MKFKGILLTIAALSIAERTEGVSRRGLDTDVDQDSVFQGYGVQYIDLQVGTFNRASSSRQRIYLVSYTSTLPVWAYYSYR